ncbi:leucine-rich repeat-containing protein 37B-like isoform X1 [Lepus europaeus]|uniref:leucine-rich repeat-containing protein 37B-like isoform X1 n=1 Tax=Lepus europaeus TaxID=9983 RepID=UPI002B4A2511|nr:leucine-rich repeat-containing protein 37B-like isoform X1 [Lepus europaeus]
MPVRTECPRRPRSSRRRPSHPAARRGHQKSKGNSYDVEGKFLAFYQYAKSFNSDDFDYEELKNGDYVFMRWKMLASLRESTVSLVAFLDMDSARGLPPEPEQLAVPYQYFNRLTRQQRLPVPTPVLDRDQDQPLVLPPRLEGKVHPSFEALVPPLHRVHKQTS